MKRSLNFGAGPAAMPLPVLQQIAEEWFDFAGTGASVVEVSHRSPEYAAVHSGTQAQFKELLGLGDDHEVLFFGGGATTQFAAVAMNLLGEGKVGDYLVTGSWSKKAVKEAQQIGDVHVAATSEPDKFTWVPSTSDCTFSDRPAYVHLTSNNTIAGTQYQQFPKCPAPIVADMSSDILWRPLDVAPFGMIYAGSQKNLGPAGVTVVIIKKELLERCNTKLPSMLSYSLQADKQSLFNTPPVFSIYAVGKTLSWIKQLGGLSAMEKRNRDKAALLYSAIDRHEGFYRSPIRKDSRSLMNVVFRLPSEQLEKKFIADAKSEANMIGLKGHRSVGGIRASIYNAAEPAWIETLVGFMDQFAASNG